MLCALANAQHIPGGVASPYLWNANGDTVGISDSLIEIADGLTTFQVVVPDGKAENATLTSGVTLVTSRRLAEPQRGQYINFEKVAEAGIPRIISVRRRLAETDSTNLSIAELPLSQSECSDSVCESVVFCRMLNSSERQRVDTYLALKYGITIDQTVPSSYVGSNGRVIWDAEANAKFSHRIFGVCNDTISGLYSSEMSSIEESNLLTINADTIPPMSYIVLGDDNGSLKYIRKESEPKRL